MGQLAYSTQLFEPHVGSTFAVIGDGGPTSLLLDQVAPRPSPPGHEQFSLIFLAEDDEAPTQNTYRLHHEDLGEMELFLVPVGRVEAGIEFEACFNLLVADD